MKKVLDIRDLSFVVADKQILKGVCWQVQKGERWALLGANGAGKTSLLSTICGYNTPSCGTMSVDGKTYSEYEWQKVRERIAIVSSQLNRQIGPTETVLETVVSGAYAMLNFWGDASAEVCRRAIRKMSELEIGHLAPSLWGRISQGERQKVLIARALMVRPAVIFLDEPCTGLDPVARDRFVAFMDSVSSSGKIPAVVLATHHVEEIPPSFTHAIVLKGGTVLKSGEIGSVVASDTLSEAYGAKCRVSRRGGRFSLRVC